MIEYTRQIPNPTMERVKQLKPGEKHIIETWNLKTPPGLYIRSSIRNGRNPWQRVSVRKLKDGRWEVTRIAE